ncbi:HEAT repeat domain-containing protein [Chitinophaga silvatica]|uniref:HEAT repeat domain-containing protein n=1 Tax=Chitinophaga silvatica TaxID=2282649 RepID=A0A3E1YGT3_9BACT|nr:HEAT repeat domain-containing protein [Chitinophaga silvatica]RFS26577.1 HEAT repeat domain-containing protein [Chitinophaga silvatica]
MTDIYKKLSAGLLILSSFASTSIYAQQIEAPGLKTASTSFAIVVDDVTLQKSGAAIKAYKQALEAQGLATYIVSKKWGQPEEIRAVLQKLYKAPIKLEGAVLVGDIPVPMIRNAQHLTSAFKMDQRHDWKRSSVPSDRFYDDFDLQFEFLKQDSIQKNYYYYNLKATSPQNIQMDIYTGRIKPPVQKGEDIYAKISDYLMKVVAEKKQNNELNDAMVFSGQGYHSESLNAWAGEQLALKEQFPHLFAFGNSIKFMNFRMATYIKFNLLSEIQRPELDMALFHEHGDEETQILSAYPLANNPQPSIDNIKRFLRSKIQSASRKKGADIQKVKQGYVESMGVPMSWMDDALDPAVMLADSISDANKNIVIEDMVKVVPNARFVMLDACINGAFHLDDYLAGHYSFGKGKTIVTMANSVGVIQDQWSDELLGLLQYGVRIGNWLRETAWLETHLIGDPTFAFTNNNKGIPNINNLIVKKTNDPDTWVEMLKRSEPDLQCLAMKHLYNIQHEKISSNLKNIYFSSTSMIVRLEAIKLLHNFNNADYHMVLKAAINDPYELTRRLAATWLGDWGSDEAVPALVNLAIADRHSRRVSSQVRNSFAFMNPKTVIDEVNKQISNDHYFVDSSEFRTKLIEDQLRTEKSLKDNVNVMMDKSQKQKERLFNITTLRAYNYHQAFSSAIQLASDKTEDEKLRVAVIEALSWQEHSYKKADILQMCKKLLADASESAAVKEQVLRTEAILLR